MNNTLQYPVILFDGVCNLCTSSVQFIIKRDDTKHFRFASLQSDIAQQLLTEFSFTTSSSNLATIVLIERGKLYTQSTAVLKIVKHLNGGWPLLYVFILVPAFIRDSLYNFISQNRYKWFGKKEVCWMPTEDLKERFLS
jgi:predicted DCC family thiol-disulfide oxidoreductase YuxK